MNYLIYSLTGYSFGLIQGAYIISKIIGRFDIRDKGSGNAGASNITNIMGWKYGIIVAFIDIFKAFIPMITIKYFLNPTFNELFILGFSTIIGHIYPIHLKFRGGKGAASFIGMCYGLNLLLGLLMSAIIILTTVISDYIFLGSLAIFVSLPLILFFTNKSILSIGLSIIIFIIGLIKHRSNIISFKNGKEVGLRSVIKKHRN